VRRLVTIIALLIATPVSGECLRYGDVSFTGRLMQQVYAGPPDFESVTKGDEPLVIWILLLETGICIVDGDSIFPRTFSEREIQLVLGADQYARAAEYAPYRHLLGKSISVTGTLVAGGAKYEKRFVLMPREIRRDQGESTTSSSGVGW
jgi:Domain of unknown function (DUF4431)